MAVNIGPKIGIDGEAQFRKELNNIIQQSKTLASEMKAVTSAFDKNDNSQEKLAAQSAVLTKQIETQEQRIEQLKKGLAASAKEFGEADTRTQKWKQAVNDATSELNNMRSNLKGLDTAVDDTADNLDDAADSALSFGDVLKANVLSQAIVNGVKELASAFKDFAVSAIESAADVKAQVAQFEQTFGDLADTAREKMNSVAEATGIVPTRLQSAFSQFYAYARSSGMESAQALQFAEKASYAAADAAAYYDRSLEEATEQVLAYTKGNFANDAALGFASTEATRTAQAMKSLGKEYKDLDVTAGETTQVLLDQIIASQNLSGAAGQASREMDGWENVQGNLNETWKQFQARVGTPVLENLIPIIQNITSEFENWMNNVDWDAFGKNIDNFVNALIDYGPVIISTLSGIAAGFVAWNIASLISGISGIVSGAKNMADVFPLVAKAMQALSANPIGAVITLVATLATTIITLWNTNEEFRNGVIEIWDRIKEGIGNAVDGIVHFFTVTVPQAFNKVLDFVKTNWQGLLLLLVNPFAGAFKLLYDNFEGFRNAVNNLVERIKTAFIIMKDGISNTVRNIKDAIVNGFQAAVDFITSLPGKAVQWGRDFIQGLVDGIISMASRVVDAVKGIANTITSWLHFSRPDVGPLRDYETWMPDMVQGMAEGVRANAYKLENAVASMAGGMSVNVNGKAGASNMGGVYITVNGAPGQDENRLADIIMLKIQNATARREAVW
ncbi:hypothetical protein TQ39_17545 [Ruthenibacterium lactatiformans]|uniref:Phage tail tape measure protein n=1 Tax=Ruthenibacterium lactatiformans TaxID=1550024 RepID=A0A0D8IW58_9FIRM|nr:hypothetical protein [Ruthenibacterium lactatiformans]KJF38526.1 hypothetical protein TQ39_17545 [Ruthenibacterium lactatiformans]